MNRLKLQWFAHRFAWYMSDEGMELGWNDAQKAMIDEFHFSEADMKEIIDVYEGRK